MTILEVRDLTKRCDKESGVSEISFKLAEGEILGIYGASGSGKTLLLRLLSTLLEPDSGSATLLGSDIYYDIHSARIHTGYMQQHPGSIPRLTVMKYLKYTGRFYEADSGTRIERLTEELKLDPDLILRGLSVTDLKKTAFAAALIHSPKLVLLDEPFEGIDETAKILIGKTIKQEAGKGICFLVTGKTAASLKPFCQKMNHLEKGRFQAESPSTDLSLWKNEGRKVVTVQLYKPIRALDYKGVERIVIENDRMEITYSGHPNTLIQLLKSLPTKDVSIGEPKSGKE